MGGDGVPGFGGVGGRSLYRADSRSRHQSGDAHPAKSKELVHEGELLSCHQQVFPALAFRVAREHGIAVDESAAHADAAAAFGYFSNFQRAVEYTNIIDPALSDGYGMLAANAAGVRPSLVTAVYARLLAARKRTVETDDKSPPPSLIALSPRTQCHVSSTYPSQKADPRDTREPGCSPSTACQPRNTSIAGIWLGAENQAALKMAAELKALRRADGGWNSLARQPSECILHWSGVDGSARSGQHRHRRGSAA